MIQKYVRLATREDLPVVLKYAKNFHKASPYRSMRFDSEKSKKFFESTLGASQTSVMLIALKSSEPIGFLTAMAAEPVFSSEKISMELAWWVEPEHRRTRSSYLLFKAYEDWALRVGCSYVQGAYLPGVSTDLDDFYRSQGYTEVESSYMKRIKL